MEVTVLYTVSIGVIAFALSCYRYIFKDRPNKPGPSSRGYNMLYSPWCLFILPPFLIVFKFFANFGREIKVDILSLLVSSVFFIMVTIMIYYGCLFVVTKLMREKLYADTMIILWMLPGLLYFRMINADSVEAFLVIPVPAKAAIAVLIIWFAGFVVKFGRAYLSHKRFVKEIMEDAREITADAIEQTIWILRKEIAEMLQQNHVLQEKQFNQIRVYRSGRIRTPLTIGFSYGSAKIILPEREYTREELCWIFRHELIHIVNQDTSNKLFMTLCSSLLWFFPLFESLTKKAYEDIELSCDEEVLGGTDEETKRFYGNLILRTAGESRGFTSCLSANASSMRYRLQRIMKPVKKNTGKSIFIITLMAMILSLSYGNITLAVNPKPLSEVIFQEDEEYEIYDCIIGIKKVDIPAEDVKKFLNQTEIYKLEKVYNANTFYNNLSITLRQDRHEYHLLFDGHEVSFWDLNNDYYTFYIPEDNWQIAWKKLGIELPESL